MPSDMVLWDPINRELRFRLDYFEDKPDVIKVVLLPGIVEGGEIHPGAEVADLVFRTGSPTAIDAPPGCDGIMDFVNATLDPDELGLSPSQVILHLHPKL